MSDRSRGSLGWALVLLVAVSAGCVPEDAQVLSMDSLSYEHDQMALARYFTQEAATMRQRASELRETAALYEELFGRDSQQVKSTIMLAEFYEGVAEHREREARLHLEAARRSRGGKAAAEGTPHETGGPTP